MTAIRDEIMAMLHRGMDPWQHVFSIPPEPIQGWNSDHPWLGDAIAEIKPQIVVEIGVWKGASVATMAMKMRDLGLNGVVIAVDTWLGSVEHWWEEGLARDLPFLYPQFLCNIANFGLTDYVVPLPLDSLNAARLLRRHGIAPQMIHLDAGHDYNSVFADLTEWWSVLEPGGLYLGDDYYLTGEFPAVKIATDQFFEIAHVQELQCMAGKCRVKKSAVDHQSLPF